MGTNHESIHGRTFLRQAVVIVHGMGEQRPGGTLNQFSDFLGDGPYYRPDMAGDTYDGRYAIFPAPNAAADGNDDAAHKARVQTDVYEYHWAHLMQGNRLDDLWPVIRRMLLPVSGKARTALAVVLLIGIVAALVWEQSEPGPDAHAISALVVLFLLLLAALWRWIPSGLLGLWFILWGAILGLGWFIASHLSDITTRGEDGETLTGIAASIATTAGFGAITVAVVAYVVARVLPSWLTASFVDVVRYVDTSPRSYAIRTEIRKGMVELLARLHTTQLDGRNKYDRIVVAGHSLGSIIAYDGIVAYWTGNRQGRGLRAAEALDSLTTAAIALRGIDAANRRTDEYGADERAAYRSRQRDAWRQLDSRWRITDFVSFGSPLTFAHMLITRDKKLFEEWLAKRILVTCPPVPDDPRADYRLTWKPRDSGRVLHEAAPFAVVRWTNLYYRAKLSFFGDWFGGPLAPLFAAGIEDIEVKGDGWRTRVPAWPHTLYLSSRARKPGATSKTFRDHVLEQVALDLLGRTSIRTTASASSTPPPTPTPTREQV